MGLFGLFKKKSDETKVGNVEDFISLTRVYFQSVIALSLIHISGMYTIGIAATVLTLVGLELLSYLFKSIGMKSSMVSFRCV